MGDFFKLPDPTIAVPDVEDVLRATAPGPVVIARSDQAAVVLTELAAFPDGFSLKVTSYRHRSVKLPDQLNLMMSAPWRGSDPLADEHLKIGLSWPDGAVQQPLMTGNATSNQRRRLPTTGWKPLAAVAASRGSPSSAGPGRYPAPASCWW